MVIRFISLCNGFHWLDDIATAEQNGFCVSGCLSLFVCMCLHLAEVMTKYLLLITGFPFFLMWLSMLSSAFNLILQQHLHTLWPLFPRTA